MSDLTNPSGTGDQTPDGATASGSAAQPPQPTIEQLQQQLNFERQQAIFWKERHGASTVEAQRLYRLNQERERAEAEAAVAPTKTMSQAMLDGDEPAIQQHMRIVQDNAERSAMLKMQTAVTTAQREQALGQFIASVPGMNDPNSGVQQQIMQQYEAIKNDSRYAFLDRTEQPLSNGSTVAPAVLAAAVDRVMGRLEQSAHASEQGARRGLDSFSEPAGGGRAVQPGQRGASANADTPLLTQRELELCQQTARIDRISVEDAAKKRWKFTHPDEKAKRIRAGRAE